MYRLIMLQYLYATLCLFVHLLVGTVVNSVSINMDVQVFLLHADRFQEGYSRMMC